MGAPTVIQEIMYTDGTVLDHTRSTQAGSVTTYWLARNLPTAGQAALDSTIGTFNCEVMQFYFSGHGSGNYVTNFKFYVADRNSVAQDMTHMFYVSDSFSNPSGIADADIYNMTGDWTTCPVAVPDSTNILPYSGYLATDDPLVTQFVYFGIIVEANKTTGSASWKNRLMYQYT